MRYRLDDGITADVSPRAIVCDIACPRLAVLKSHDYRLAFGWWFISRLPCADFADKARSRLYRADVSRFSVASYQFIWFVNYCSIHLIQEGCVVSWECPNYIFEVVVVRPAVFPEVHTVWVESYKDAG